MATKGDPLDSTIDALLNTGDALEMQEILRQTPLLLSDRGLERVRQRAADARAKGQTSLIEMLDALESVVTQVKLDLVACPSTQVIDAVDALLKAHTWDESQTLFQRYPELSTDEADARLEELLRRMRAAGEGDAAFLEENLALLRRCRAIGLEAAFEEKTHLVETVYDFVEAATWDDAREVLKVHPELLSDEVDRMLAHMAQDARADRSRDAAVFLEENRALLARCREVGEEQAFQEVAAAPIGDLVAAMDEYLDAPTWAESRRVLEAHPQLLKEDADQMLADLIESARQEHDEQGAEFFAGRRQLLRLCREKGLDAVFGGLDEDTDED